MNLRRFGVLTVGLLLACGLAAAQWTWTPETGRFVNLKRMPKETPELQVEYARSLLVEGKYDQAMDETGKFRRFYGDSEYADENQKLRGDIRLAEGNLTDAAEEYQQVISGYPSSPLYDEVIRQQYVVADTLFERGREKAQRINNAPFYRLDHRLNPIKYRPLRKATDVYNMVIDNQPFTDTAAEAQYKVGLCYYTREAYLEAAFEYRRVLEDYGNSEWVQEALYGLAKAYEGGSNSPDYDQAPSQLTLDTIARNKRQFPGDERAAELEEIAIDMRNRIARQHLNIGRHYDQRGSEIAARMSFEKVVNDYPDTESAPDALKWLEDHPPDGRLYSTFIASSGAGE